jgi:hypothetical protein
MRSPAMAETPVDNSPGLRHILLAAPQSAYQTSTTIDNARREHANVSWADLVVLESTSYPLPLTAPQPSTGA